MVQPKLRSTVILNYDENIVLYWKLINAHFITSQWITLQLCNLDKSHRENQYEQSWKVRLGTLATLMKMKVFSLIHQLG